MLDELRVRDDRLRWHCRRALLELDIVFSRFWTEQQEAPLSEVDALELQHLLALEDHELWQLVSGKAELPEKNKVLERLRAL